ncbi:MAG: phosphate acyltransferase [Gammaproteobacteria bacterium RIFCSPHIGHO2_12_FULL_41_20]|nr:MAG: phosphate acyltransferase [Gammaproteobacteria bacterium RIFCSPHIGHO2_12_FULL_41_20]
MGGDYGPPVTIAAALRVLTQHSTLRLILVGDEAVLRESLRKAGTSPSERLIMQHASQHVEMDESPTQALRTKKDSSMRVAINLVKDGTAQACVSAGNTGALMATARFVLKTLPGIDRPAIVSAFPTLTNNTSMRMLDLGANVDSTSENLLQFAVMGSVLAQAIDNIEAPRVCLLNIGTEEIKGNELVKQTAQLLFESKLVNYLGYIEGDELYSGKADVIVCDGFVGNVALKTSEGVADLIINLLKCAFQRNWLTRLAGMVVFPLLKPVTTRVDPARYNGASLIGLQGIVIKSHGGARIRAFAHAIEEAIIEVERNIPECIRNKLAALLKSTSSPNGLL